MDLCRSRRRCRDRQGLVPAPCGGRTYGPALHGGVRGDLPCPDALNRERALHDRASSCAISGCMVRLPRRGGLARNMSSRAAVQGLAIAGIALCLAMLGWRGLPSPAMADEATSFSKQTIDRTLQQVISDQDIQHDPPQPLHMPSFNWNLGDLRIPLYVLLGIGLLLVLWYVGKAVLDIARPTGDKVAKEASDTVASQPLAPDAPESLPELEEIMRLARAGEYEAA